MSRVRNLAWFAEEFFGMTKAPILRSKQEESSFTFQCSSEFVGRALEDLIMAFTAVWGGPGSFLTRIYTTDELAPKDSSEIVVSVTVFLP